MEAILRRGFWTHAECNCKIAHATSENVQHPVGADASVRPLGNCGFAATLRENGRASCGRTESSALRVHTVSHWCVRVCGVILPGGAEPLPYGNCDRLYGFALVRPDLQMPTAQSLRHGFAVPPPFTQGRLWRGGKPPNGIAVRGHILFLADNLNPRGRADAVRTCRDHSERRLAVADAARRLDLHGGADAFAHERHVVLRRAAA